MTQSLGDVDLNLLVPLDALLTERHVSRAGERVGLSQPAMSRALQRLRVTIGDELLVRNGSGYELTARAQGLRRELDELMPDLRAMFTLEAFEPAAIQDLFRIAVCDYTAAVLAPLLWKRFWGETGQPLLRFGPWHGRSPDELESGLVSLALATAPEVRALRSELLLTDRFVCLVAEGHPLAAAKEVSMVEYLDCAHLAVNFEPGAQAALDAELAAAGRPRRLTAFAGYFQPATLVVAATDLMLTLPSRLAYRYAESGGLRVVEGPRELPPVAVRMLWPPRLDDDPGHRWLRGLVRTAGADLLDQPSSAGG